MINKKHLAKAFATSFAFVTALAVASPSQMVVAQGQKPPPTTTPWPRSKWVTQPIKFGKLQVYEHSQGWFDIKLPDTWEKEDNSTDSEAILLFSDATQNAAVVVRVFAGDAELTKEEMGENLDKFIRDSYKTLPKFKANKPGELDNLNGAFEVFLYQQKLSNGKLVNVYGDAYLEQHENNLMSLTILLLPEDQYQVVKKQAYDIVNSLNVYPDAYIASTQNTNTENTNTENTTGNGFSMGNLTDYEHPTGVFRLQVPDDWKEVDSSTDGFPLVVWVEPTGLGVMSASATKVQKALKASELQTNIVSFINGYAKGNKKMKAVKIGEKSSRTNEAAASFSFTNEINGEDVTMFGIATVKQNSKTVSYLLVTLPQANLTDAGDKPTEIFDSFKVDGAASF